MTTGQGTACPKCGRPRTDGAPACARCGLTFARWSPASITQTATPLDERGAQMWSALPSAWEDQTAHDAFVKHCAQVGQLTAAGRSYRAHLDRHPGDPVATRMQARIVGMATAALLPARSAPVPVARNNWFLYVIAVAAVLGVLGGMFFKTLAR